MRGETLAEGAVERAVEGLRDHPQAGGLDTLVLACTHFPLLSDELRQVFGQDIRLVDGAEGIARRIASLTKGQAFAREHQDFAVATGSTQGLTTLAPMLERHGLMRATQF